MNGIILIDTSVYLNILDVPGLNQNRSNIISEFGKFIDQNFDFMLPLATIWETANHIAHLPDGGRRWQCANKLIQDVTKALDEERPYIPTRFPGGEDLRGWLSGFADAAKAGKTLSDHSIIQEWEWLRRQAPRCRIMVWSLDGDLAGYDHSP